jgi:cytoskeletal protein CcmA (bactofilin family)
MAEIKQPIEDENKIDTVIADDINFKGTLKFKNSLKLKGKFEGKIETDGHLIIGREAEVSANISAKTVAVSGIVNGKLKAKQKISLHKNSKTRGDLITPDLLMENGALFNGTCIMEGKS